MAFELSPSFKMGTSRLNLLGDAILAESSGLFPLGMGDFAILLFVLSLADPMFEFGLDLPV